MNNRIFLNEDRLIEIDYRGLQTTESIQGLLEAYLLIAQQMKVLNLPVRVIVDLETAGKATLESRRLITQAMRQFRYDRVAFYGGPSFIRQSLRLMIQATRRSDKVMVFENRIEAEQWLLHDLLPKTAPTVNRPMDFQAYQQLVRLRIEELQQILSGVVIGDYTQKISIPGNGDEFTDIFVGIQVMIDTLQEKRQKITKLDRYMKSWEKKEGSRIKTKKANSRTDQLTSPRKRPS